VEMLRLFPVCLSVRTSVPRLAVPKSPSSIMGILIYSAGFSLSCLDSISGRDSTSGIAAELRPHRTCDLRIIPPKWRYRIDLEG